MVLRFVIVGKREFLIAIVSAAFLILRLPGAGTVTARSITMVILLCFDCGDDLRLFTKTSRDSKAWHKVYARRSSSERCNKRIKNDYELEHCRARSRKNWCFFFHFAAMNQHLDAWLDKVENKHFDIWVEVLGKEAVA